MIIKNNNGSDYIFGEKISCADVFFYPQIMASKHRFKIDITPYKNVSRILENLEKIKEFKDSEPEKQKDF
jgi:glutathione S-transferase